MGKRYFYTIVALILGSVLNSCKTSEKNSWSIESPDKNIRATINYGIETDSAKLYYSVFIKENDAYVQVMEPSLLGIESERAKFVKNLKLLKVGTLENQQVEYTMSSGNKKKYINSFNGVKLSFENENHSVIDIAFRIFNNGIAFRYEFPKNGLKKIRIINDFSSFNFGAGNFWAHPYDELTDWTPAYETYYKSSLKIGTKSPENKNGWAFPMLFETQNHWLFVSESGLDGSFGASHIQSDCTDGEYHIKFAEPKEARGFYDYLPTMKSGSVSPWRFITIGKSLADIVESHMVTDLAKPNVLSDTSWIKPGRASWSWWSESDSPQDYEKLLPFIDLASQMGWEYSLIDANWNKMKNGSIEKLTKYAKSKNVGLLLWYNSGGKHNIVTEEPRNLLFEKDVRQKEFARISNLGIKGIKVDFFQSDKQRIIKQYLEILEDAAKYKLLVNFHGCTLPRGWRRTYPNLLSMEAIKGSESYKFDAQYPKKAPSHIATIPFLRGLAGPTDYAPLCFSDSKFPHLTTNGFELALPLIIESGIIHYAENFRIIKAQPDFVIDFLKELPSSWDDIKYLAGYPGKDIVIARKKGDKWYIGGINGEKTEKNYTIDLSVLNLKKSEFFIIKDKKTGKDFEFEKIQIKNNEFSVNMLPFGGFVGVLSKF